MGIIFAPLISKVARLLYTNSGVGILALGTNGVQRLWKWSRSEQNPTGKVMQTLTSTPCTVWYMLYILHVCIKKMCARVTMFYRPSRWKCFFVKATASVTPQHWQPNSGLLMTNDVPENPEGTVPCIALSKNDSYVMSACGGKVSLFNMMTFKVNNLSNLFSPVLRQLHLCMWCHNATTFV